jgi:phosphoglycolate phosphatase-like HAD superfamily hydrolase
MDGTFLDSFPSWFECCLGVAHAHGWLIDDRIVKIIQDNWGAPTALIVDKCWPGVDHWLLQKALNDPKRMMPPPPLFPGAFEVLWLLKDRADLYMNTGLRRERVVPVLAHHGLMDCFSRLSTRSDVKTTKPSPEGVERLIAPLERKLGYGRDLFLFIGDNHYTDGECAKAAGIDFLAVAESANVGRKILIENGVPDAMIIDKFRDLPAWLGIT